MPDAEGEAADAEAEAASAARDATRSTNVLAWTRWCWWYGGRDCKAERDRLEAFWKK